MGNKALRWGGLIIAALHLLMTALFIVLAVQAARDGDPTAAVLMATLGALMGVGGGFIGFAAWRLDA